MSRAPRLFLKSLFQIAPLFTTTLLACGGRDAAREAPAGDSATSAAPAPADSLVATAPGGVQVWFTLARAGQAEDGARCIDRTLEIRRGGARVPVPLLYTASAPELVNDTTIRARLSFRCKPGDAYLVDLRSGRPTRERHRRRAPARRSRR
jgi:hypothetical protein